MDINNYLWYPYLRYQQECRENGKEDSIQEWLELTGKVTVTKPKKVVNKTANTKRVRNRNAKGHFVKDDPNTKENEAWKVVEIAKEIAPKIIPYNRPKKRRKTNKKKD